MYDLGGTITARFIGDPTDIGALWLVGITVTPSFHGEIAFSGAPTAGHAAVVPEPPSALLLAAGVAWAALFARRRRRARPR